jgi:transposase
MGDDVWSDIARHLPPRRPRKAKGGPRLRDDRACFEGILHVMREGIRWQSLPSKLGYGSGSTCWRRFREWTSAGLWDNIQPQLEALLDEQARHRLRQAILDSQQASRSAPAGDHRSAE